VKEEGEEATVARGEPFFILRLIISDCKLSATTNERLLLVSPFLSLSLSLSLSLLSRLSFSLIPENVALEHCDPLSLSSSSRD